MEMPATEKDIMRSVAFTGYRPKKLPFGNDLTHPDAIRLRANLKTEYERLINRGFRQFLTGGALGCDLMAAEVILELKEKYGRKPRIMHVLCMPCFDYTAKWSDEDKERLEKIKEKSVHFYVSDSTYYNGCMQKRNRYMVDTSRVLLAVYDGKSGGTRNTVEYARSRNRKVVVINPSQFVRIELIETPQDIQLMLTDDDEDQEYLNDHM